MRRFQVCLTTTACAWLLMSDFAVAAGSGVGSTNPLNAATASAFADEEIPAAMRDGKIPGAVFVVVRDDQIICEKAYGVSDLKTRKPVSADQTLFRVASISKILTAASVLQLVHAHSLNLHCDVNSYLQRFQIAPAYGKPITLFNLLTHSSGFDVCAFGYAARSAADRLSLRNYLTKYQPARVRPPGLFSVYDNYGFALAGYLVQKISGISFANYVQEQIFYPLNMEHSSFSPDATLRRETATGYWLEGKTPNARAENYVNIVPAAGLRTTASDMANFLIALLADKSPNGTRAFPASVIQGLETRQFASAPELAGRCYGFNCVSIAGCSALRQTGQWPGFDSVLILFPKQHCGLFLAYNLCDYLQMERHISRLFAEKFIPPDLPGGALDKESSRSGNSIASLLGSYLSLRASDAAPRWGFPSEIEVTKSPNGQLEIAGQSYHEMEPRVFAKIETNHSVSAAFGRHAAFLIEHGNTWLVTQGGTFRRATGAESAQGRTILLTTATLIFISAFVLWPLMVFCRLAFAKKPATGKSRPAIIFSLAARGTALAACALALWFELFLALAERHLKPFADFYGVPVSLRHALWSLPVLMLFTAAMGIFFIIVWRRRIWHPAHRLHYAVLIVALGIFLYSFYTRHLLFVG